MDLCQFAKRPWAIPALRRHFGNQAITVLSASCCNGCLLLLNEYVPRHGCEKRGHGLLVLSTHYDISLDRTAKCQVLRRWILMD